MSPPADTELDLDPKRAKELIAAGEVQVVDVRTAAERAEARIAGSLHIELTELAAHADDLDRERPILFYCATGSRSGMARDALREAGWDARNLNGGIEAWSADGLPTESGVE